MSEGLVIGVSVPHEALAVGKTAYAIAAGKGS